ncbi:streptomycin biosynthesis protein StrI [Punctularia strigosozonata HHB-11173 SS5]|uniref:streptomycin biosynthesis protein StrI n=1 Tax=Punctularia strigosozonata (strain HHB-11173) TaxID=741275 RepID=UPI0004417A78|nr:streptomycin biosynthesis protein StrI [Punctularia strigosozonata HHB-11173 SS5]EIN10574.1 streptomycin biosynthesis protein StrI [Punctularia strigosozonata HHB-11173 SS5]
MPAPLVDPVTIAVVGCGSRGNAYAQYALDNPAKCQVVAIAEPRPKTRRLMADTHRVDPTLTFTTWQDLHAASAETLRTIGKRLADAVLITVQDHMHAELVEVFAEQGYHILCEKPMATSISDCIKIEAAVKKAGIIFGMGHVLRYSPYSKAITEIIRSGQLGTLVNAVHVEPVGHWHFAHSYVRGSWAREDQSSFSLMTKSCHDIDILCHWFADDKPARVSSFGSLFHFRKSAKPAEAGDATRCLNCAYESQCPYSAKKVYIDSVARGNTGWPASVTVDGIPDIENVTEAIRNGPYGRCAYECDNDVCDNQVVNIEFGSGATASFTMVAQTSLICERQTRLHFTHGEIVGDMTSFTVSDFRTRQTTQHRPRAEGGHHGGGDTGLIRAFVEAVRTGSQHELGTHVGEVLNSHLTVFAAEASRREGRVVNCQEFEAKARESVQA